VICVQNSGNNLQALKWWPPWLHRIFGRMCAINVFDDQPIVGANSPLFATEATCPLKKD
jgi:hypothetical protein